MQTYKFSELTWESLNSLMRLRTVEANSERWDQEQIELTDEETQQIALLKKSLAGTRMMSLNEATIWARAIYPLLMMAERRGLQALSQVEMTAQFRNFTLTGTADGLLARIVLSEIAGPFLLVAEAKKGIDAKNPVYQLLGGMYRDRIRAYSSFGIAFGNLLQGVPFHLDRFLRPQYEATFIWALLGLLNPFALLAGLFVFVGEGNALDLG